jgi:hypothetical protein
MYIHEEKHTKQYIKILSTNKNRNKDHLLSKGHYYISIIFFAEVKKGSWITLAN